MWLWTARSRVAGLFGSILAHETAMGITTALRFIDSDFPPEQAAVTAPQLSWRMTPVTVDPRWYVILTRGPHHEQFHQPTVKDQFRGNATVRPIQCGNLRMLGLCAACRWVRKLCGEAFPITKGWLPAPEWLQTWSAVAAGRCLATAERVYKIRTVPPTKTSSARNTSAPYRRVRLGWDRADTGSLSKMSAYLAHRCSSGTKINCQSGHGSLAEHKRYS